MNIEDKRSKTINYRYLQVGDVFEWNNGIYMKLRDGRAAVLVPSVPATASRGGAVIFNESTQMVKLNATLVINS